MSKYEVRYLSEEEYPSWDGFVDESEHGTIFHKSYWNRKIYSSQPGVSLAVAVCFNPDNQIMGGVIFGWKRKLGRLKVMVPPPATCFYGLLVRERNTSMLSKIENQRFEIMHLLLGFLEKNFDGLVFSVPEGFTDIRVFNWRKYRAEVLYTYIGNISTPEENLQSFMPDIRRRIKNAEENDYRIRTDRDPDQAEAVVELLKKSFERQDHSSGFSIDSLTELAADESVGENLRFYTVWTDQRPVAGIVVIVDRQRAYYWLAGGDHEYFRTGLNQLLFWKMINELSNEGVQKLDLVGANTRTVSKYKSSYNFELVSYFRLSKQVGTFTNLLYFLKRIARG